MKKIQLLLLMLTISAVPTPLAAQDVTLDEILDGFFENTGGMESWENLMGIRMIAKLNQEGIEIPLEVVNLADGKKYTKFNFQGNDFMQDVYDGETLWNTNFQTLKAEKANTEETANEKLDANDFPDPFLNYKEKNYQAELLGTETIGGAETYKVKLTKEPIMVDGQEVEDVTYYYFETESFVVLAQDSEVKSGPQAGLVQRVTMSDYQEVDGLYFPFSITQSTKGGPSQPIMIESIEVNPEIDDTVFAFPEADK